MALSPAQQQKMEELKNFVAKWKQECFDSSVMMTYFGSYIFEQFRILDKLIADVENA